MHRHQKLSSFNILMINKCKYVILLNMHKTGFYYTTKCIKISEKKINKNNKKMLNLFSFPVLCSYNGIIGKYIMVVYYNQL